MAAGLMGEEEADVFLKVCSGKDEYLTAMVLNHCGNYSCASLARRGLIRKSQRVSVLSYWIGNILQWGLVVQLMILLLIAKNVLRGGGYAFQQPSGVSVPVLGPYLTEDLLQFFVILVLVIALRRVSDYLVFVRFNTIIRALQHSGSPEARSELMRVFRRFSEAARIDLNYLTVIRRVVVSNICTQTELIDGLDREGERLYSITALATVGELQSVRAVSELIRTERDRFVLEAAVDCVVSVADRYPQCKRDEAYKEALRHAAVSSRLTLPYRLKAYAHFVEATGAAGQVPYPKQRWLEGLRTALLSPQRVTYYLLGGIVVIVASQTGLLSVFRDMFSDFEPASVSGQLLLVVFLLNVIIFVMVYLGTRADRGMQRTIRDRADRKWLLLGEAPSGLSASSRKEEIAERKKEIVDGPDSSQWRAANRGDFRQRTVSHGLRHGYAVDYVDHDRVMLRLMLRTEGAKAEVSGVYKLLLNLAWVAWMLTVFLLVSESQYVLPVATAYLFIGTARVIAWTFVNPAFTLVLGDEGPEIRIDGDVEFGNRRLPVSKVREASTLMAGLIADVGRVGKHHEATPLRAS